MRPFEFKNWQGTHFQFCDASTDRPNPNHWTRQSFSSGQAASFLKVLDPEQLQMLRSRHDLRWDMAGEDTIRRLVELLECNRVWVYQKNKQKETESAAQASSARAVLYLDIRALLNQIIIQERLKTKTINSSYESLNTNSKALANIKAVGRGLEDAGSGLLKWLSEIDDVVNPLWKLKRRIDVAVELYQEVIVDTSGKRSSNLFQEYLNRVQIKDYKEVVEALGFDPKKISVDDFTQTWHMAWVLAGDETTVAIITTFSKEYVKAQHSLSLSRAAGGAVFEIVLMILLAVATAGVGVAANVAAKARHAGAFARLGKKLRELAGVLKTRVKTVKRRGVGGGEVGGRVPAVESDYSGKGGNGSDAGDSGTMREGSVVPGNVDSRAVRRTYLNEKYGRTGDLNTDINIRGNKEQATNFYLEQGWHPKRVESHVGGIDFSQPVDIFTLSKGQPLSQYQVGGKGVGNYFAPVGTRAEQLGINPAGRETLIYAPTERVQVLRSTAAEIVDTWSVPGVPYRAEGGGTQFFTGDPDKFRVIINNE